MVETLPPDGRATNPAVSHERSDAYSGWIIGIGLGSLGVAVLIQIGLLWFFRDYASYQGKIKQSPFPLQAGEGKVLPSEPRLEQITQMEGGSDRLVGEQEALKKVAGRIDQAMTDLVREKKLPARKGAATEKRRDEGLEDWGAPNSGRVLRGGQR